MLRLADGERGMNFFPLQQEILAVVKERIGVGRRGVERFRLLCNMLSSQPMCFNLFGFLKILRDKELKSRLVAALVPHGVERVNAVELEYPVGPNTQLGDGTSFDAFIDYTRIDGGRSFLGIETKLTEPFSPTHYPLDSRDTYPTWTRDDRSPWPEESWQEVDAVAHNQLWRNHMLTTAMLLEPGSPYSSGYCMLIRHPEDLVCAEVVAGYRGLLKPNDGTFLDWPLGQMMDGWQPILWETAYGGWLGQFLLRYLHLEASEVMWIQRRNAP